MDEELELTLLEAVWTMRWNKTMTAMAAVLTEKEARTICKNIISELDKAGYEIVEKDRCTCGGYPDCICKTAKK